MFALLVHLNKSSDLFTELTGGTTALHTKTDEASIPPIPSPELIAKEKRKARNGFCETYLWNCTDLCKQPFIPITRWAYQVCLQFCLKTECPCFSFVGRWSWKLILGLIFRDRILFFLYPYFRERKFRHISSASCSQHVLAGAKHDSLKESHQNVAHQRFSLSQTTNQVLQQIIVCKLSPCADQIVLP